MKLDLNINNERKFEYENSIRMGRKKASFKPRQTQD